MPGFGGPAGGGMRRSGPMPGFNPGGGMGRSGPMPRPNPQKRPGMRVPHTPRPNTGGFMRPPGRGGMRGM